MAILSCRTVLGSGPLVAQVASAWAQHAAGAITRREVRQRVDYSFEDDDLLTLPVEGEVFVAFDKRFLNFKRMELVALARARARLATVVSPSAIVGEGAMLGANVFVGEGCVIGAGAQIGEGSIIGARVVIGAGAGVGPGAWLEPGVIVGAEARLRDQVTLGLGVSVADGIEVGALCVLDVAGVYRRAVSPRTFYNPLFDAPIRIVG